jgi:protein SCO1/2
MDRSGDADVDRRSFLRSAGAAGAVAGTGGLAGCLGALGGSSVPVALPEPDRQFDSEDVPYPAWGENVPDVTLPAPLDGDEVALRTVETPSLMTFFYSHCKTVCPMLISSMRHVQTDAAENGYADQVAFLPTTFDPGRDTASRLRSYADRMDVDADAGNWHFLRPSSGERAKAVVADEFGVAFQRTNPEDMPGYMFNHASLTLLVNPDGYVERAYRAKSPDWTAIVDDLERVRNATN